MKRFLQWGLKNWSISLALLVMVLLSISIYFVPCFQEYWFGEEKTRVIIFTYIGAIGAGIFAVGNLYENARRNNLSQKSIELTQKSNMDIRFKDAATLLGSQDSSSILAGIFALHQIAEDSSKSQGQDDYVNTINEIFCATIRESNKDTFLLKTILSRLSSKFYKIRNFVKINLTEKDLSFANFTGADLTNACLSGKNSNLTGANFTNAILINADLANAKLTDANFTNADLTGAKLNGADLTNADLTGTKLTGVNFSDALFYDVKLTNNDFFAAKFTNAKLYGGTNFSGTNLKYTDFSGAFLAGNLNRANLTHANFTSADLRYVDFTSAKLTGADFSDADLSHSKFFDTDLTLANFTGANLYDADFSGAKLTHSILNGTKLSSAYFYDYMDIALPSGQEYLSLLASLLKESKQIFLSYDLTPDVLYKMFKSIKTIKDSATVNQTNAISVQYRNNFLVSGTVTNEENVPLPGVNVFIKDIAYKFPQEQSKDFIKDWFYENDGEIIRPSMTDGNGKFSIFNVPNEDSVLVFSSIGFEKQEIIIGGNRNLIITMFEYYPDSYFM